LGYSGTPVVLVILIHDDLFKCPPNVLNKKWCGGAFYPGKVCIIEWTIDEMLALTIEMNRYFLWIGGDPDWNCEYLDCLDGYIPWNELGCARI
jgi:hypothetical protein